MLGAIRSGLAHYIHPIFGNPVFLGPFTFFMGGFLTFTFNSSADDQKTLGVWRAAARKSPMIFFLGLSLSVCARCWRVTAKLAQQGYGNDGVSGHRHFVKRDSIADFNAMDPRRNTPDAVKDFRDPDIMAKRAAEKAKEAAQKAKEAAKAAAA